MIDFTNIDLQGSGMTSARTRERLVTRLMEQGIQDLRLLDVVRRTPRHIFIEEALAHRAYEDTALPIGHGQTISQPYIVARMTEALLESGPVGKVLEIGTGCGYQTSVLAQLTGRVFSIERIRPLQDKARQRLHLLKLYNVQLRHGDGMVGWQEEAPFDGIIATAAPFGIPQPLLDQLAIGGRLIIPVGRGEVQELLRITRTETGMQTEELGKVRFVPMLGGVIS